MTNLTATSTTIGGFAFIQGGSAFGSTATLGTTDANGLNLITSGSTRFGVAAGSATLTGTGATTFASNAGSALNITSGTTGVLNLDSGSTGAINLGTSANAKTLTIGNTTGATAVNINAGSGGSTYTTTNGTFNLNTGTGAINVGTDAVVKTLTIGNVTGATAVNINAGSGGGIFTSSSGLTFNPFGASAGNTTEARFAELVANGSNYVGFKSPDLLGGNVIWTLPDSDGTVGQVLTTDGLGVLSWASAGACPTCVVNTTKFNVDGPTGNITKLNNVVTSFPSSQGGSGDVLTNDGAGNLTWSPSGAGSAALSSVSAATGNATIGNGNNNINWNWVLSGATNGLNISETSASSGTGYLQRVATIATSTAKPFSIGARGTTIFDTTATGGLVLGDSATLNTPITLQSGTGAINVGTDAVAKTVTIGNTTGATTVNINAGSGGINFSGSAVVSGSNTFTTGTGTTTINSTALTLAGNSTVLDMTGTGTLGLNTTTNRAITTGTGLLTVSGAETINGALTSFGNFSTPKGADYTTTGTQNDVDFGLGSYFHYTGTGVAVFTGIAGGSDGRLIRILNDSSFDLTLKHLDSASLAINRIETPNAQDIVISPDMMVAIIYDGDSFNWHLASQPTTIDTMKGFAFVQSGNAFGTTATLGTTDANGLNLITSGATRFGIAAGSATLTGTGATSITSTAALTLDATTALNLGTATATSVAIGKTGVTTTNNGSLTSTQTLTASNGLTLTTGALNLTATSGTLSLGSATLEGASPLVFDGVTADANKTTFAITDPTASRTITFPNSSITVNAAANISGTTLASNVVTSSLTAVGALSSGSIGAGFGTISTTNDITTSGNISTTGTGTIISAGSLTASNGLTLTTGALNLTATSGALALSGLSASSINSGANDITFTSGHFNTTATGINNTAIGATTASTGAFTTLSSTGATNIATAGASNVTIATTGTGNVTVGNSTGTFALASSGGLNVTTGGALTGVASIDTIATSATALTFAGAGTISSTTSSSITLDSGTTGAINIGTGVAAKTITIGNATDDTFSLNSSGLNVSSAGALTGVTSITASGNISTSANISTTGTGTITSAGTLTGSSDISVTGSWTGNVSTTATTNSTTTSTIATKALAYYVSSTDTSGNCSTGTKTFDITGLSDTEGAHTYIVSKAIDGGCNSGTLTLTVSINGTTISTVANANTNGTVTENYVVAYVNGAWRILGTPSSTDGADLAETYGTNDESIEAGDVVAIDQTLESGIKKSSGVNDKNVIGIVSTMPAMVIGGVNNEGVTALPVALSGRVPVKVNIENGSISVGDYLTTSSVPGVAMKSNGVGVVIGQAMSPFDGSDTGVVLAFIKNFDLGNFEQNEILLGEISKTEGLDTLISTIQSENAKDPVIIIGQKIADGKEFLTDFVSARVTAIRGYFDEIFTKKVHTEEICVKKSDGNEICVNGDQINTLLNNANITPTPVFVPPPEVTPDPVPTSEPAPTPESAPETNPTPEVSSESASTPEPIAVPPPEVTPDPVPTSEPAPTPESAPVPEQLPAQ
ncbi:hypothetical protein IT399_01200 [Candidatus Nomurabacteria bacterium]|nr:hypothetical protein [Candidatus Nomurabacteria bacterium]